MDSSSGDKHKIRHLLTKFKNSIEERRNKAENASIMQGKGRKAKKAGIRFVELKGLIVERLKKVHSLIEQEAERNRLINFSVVTGGKNSKEAIERRSTIREEIRQAGDEWTELDALHKSETRKRKSRSWDESFQLLLDYKQKHGNCNVPYKYEQDPSLYSWVARQRFKMDMLSKEQ